MFLVLYLNLLFDIKTLFGMFFEFVLSLSKYCCGLVGFIMFISGLVLFLFFKKKREM